MTFSTLRITASTLEGFARDALVRSNADLSDASSVAENLIWNDLVGRTNHGCERLPILCQKVQNGVIQSPAAMHFHQSGVSCGSLDAGNGFGQIAGQRAIRHAIKLAEASGVAAISVSKSNFFGTGAAFLAEAANAKMIALVLSNSFAKVAAHGGVKPVLGTNPIAFGVPRRGGRSLLVDMSTAGLAGSTLRAHQRQGLKLPSGLVIDEKGKPITDPDLAVKGTLLPAAGAKGFGLGLWVEVLAGVLSGSGIARQVGSLYADTAQTGNSGHFVMAFDIKHWMPIEEFYDRFETLVDMIISSDPDGKVRLPGEARWDAFDRNTREGIPLEPETSAVLQKLAEKLGLSHPW